MNGLVCNNFKNKIRVVFVGLFLVFHTVLRKLHEAGAVNDVTVGEECVM